jgi:hypothetical protein
MTLSMIFFLLRRLGSFACAKWFAPTACTGRDLPSGYTPCVSEKLKRSWADEKMHGKVRTTHLLGHFV